MHNRNTLLRNLDPSDQNIYVACETLSVPYTSRPLRFSANPMFRKKTWISVPTSTLSKIEELPDYAVTPEVKRLTRERTRALGLDQGRNWDAKTAAIESAVARQDQHTMDMQTWPKQPINDHPGWRRYETHQYQIVHAACQIHFFANIALGGIWRRW